MSDQPAIDFRAAGHHDVAFAAAVSSAAEPNHPQVAEELLEKWTNTEKDSQVRRFIVQEGGLDRGWISIVQPRDSGGVTTYVNLRSPPPDTHLRPASVV